LLNSCRAAHARRREYGHVSGFGRCCVVSARSVVIADVVEIVVGKADDWGNPELESFQSDVKSIGLRDVLDVR
jgi:hypothetical protein